MTVSKYTVYIRLGQIGLYFRRLVRCVPLTATHSRLRLAWIRDHALWTNQQCTCFRTSPVFACSLILTRYSYGEHQVTFTTKRSSMDDTVPLE
ncbi:HTH_Tnp_Tc3_2 domain-containing protein [Trichonephila clavipes]|nr:HTH_Tnp_Tc3_2 domain-containing protein [Trichonephila clavipes]